jgi:hypothetical protein
MGTEDIKSSRDLITVGDIDIDVANRDFLLDKIKHIPAVIKRDDQYVKHNTGIYVTEIPTNPILSTASIDYREAEDRGYVKLDILNNSIYGLVKDRSHLLELLSVEPNYKKLSQRDFFEQIVHIGNHYNLYNSLAEPISSIEEMAMFLALIRPAKRHLVGKSWKEISKTVWEKNSDGVYGFKKSHSLAYAHLVIVHMNLLS